METFWVAYFILFHILVFAYIYEISVIKMPWINVRWVYSTKSSLSSDSEYQNLFLNVTH